MFNTFIICYYSIKDILKLCFYGLQSCLYETVMCQYFSISSSVGYQVINPHMDITIDIGVWVLKYASISSDMCLSVGSSQIHIPKYWYWLGFVKVFSIVLPNHKPWTTIGIMTSPNFIVYEIAPVDIGILTWLYYSASKGVTVHSSDENDSVCMLFTKKCVSACLSISVEHKSQWIFSC